MRTIIINILLRLLRKEYYKPLSKKAVKNLLNNLANDDGYERFPEFLEQCADLYRTQFLYTKDERFRGAVLAMTELKNRVLAERPKKAKNTDLTKDPKNGTINKTY